MKMSSSEGAKMEAKMLKNACKRLKIIILCELQILSEVSKNFPIICIMNFGCQITLQHGALDTGSSIHFIKNLLYRYVELCIQDEPFQFPNVCRKVEVFPETL